MRDLNRAVDAAAATFDLRGSPIKERELEMAFESALRAIGLKPERQIKVKLEQAWSGQVGGVDLAFDDADGERILIELKWDPNTLAACAWDSMKLAAALQAEQCDRGFLVAGSPETDPRPRGDELLEDRVISPAELRRSFAAEFDYWKADVKNHPLRAPAGWETRARGCARLKYKGAPWRIRTAEVLLTDSELVLVA